MLIDKLIECKKDSYIPEDLIEFRVDEKKDGIIEIRPGIPSLDLGEKRYAMVRVNVIDSDHYIKGMAIYSDDIPDGKLIMCYMRPTLSSARKMVHPHNKDTRRDGQTMQLITTPYKVDIDITNDGTRKASMTIQMLNILLSKKVLAEKWQKVIEDAVQLIKGGKGDEVE